MSITSILSITPNPLALTILFCAVINFSFLIYLIYKKINNTVIFWFMLFTMLNVWQALSFAFMNMSNNEATFFFWLSVNDVCTIFAAPLILSFAISFVGKDAYLKKWYVIFPLQIILYAISVYVWKTNYNTIHDIRYIVHTPWGIMPGMATGLLGGIGGLYYIFLNAIAIFFLIRFYITNKDNNKRKQTRLIILGFLLLTIGAPIITIVPEQVLHLSFLPAITYIVLILDFLVFYALLKYGVHSFNVDTISEKLLPLLPSAVVLTDKNTNLVLVNSSTENLFEMSQEELIKKTIKDLFADDTEYAKVETAILQPLSTTSITRFHDAKIMTRGGKQISVDIHATTIKDLETQETNILLIFNNIQGLKDQSTQLEQKVKEVEEQKTEFERLNRTMLNREVKMSELKEENEELERKLQKIRT